MNVQLTPEQRSQVEADMAAGRRPRIVSMPEQALHRQQLVEAERTGGDENALRVSELLRPLRVARFSGDLRRTIARQGVPQVAARARLDDRLPEELVRGHVTLSTAQIDLLVDTLGLRLMAEKR